MSNGRVSDGECSKTSNRRHQSEWKQCEGESSKKKEKKERRRGSRFECDERHEGHGQIIRVRTLQRRMF